jgi:phage shock protein A
MTTFEERWQEIDALVRRKERLQSHGERLQESVVALLATPEGRESIRTRLEHSGFGGRERFIEEVVRAFDRRPASLSSLTPRDRSDFVMLALGKTKRNQQCHWDLLWLLLRDGCNGVGSMVIDSLTKGVPKKEDLALALWSLPSWKAVARDRTAALLEAARAATGGNFDLRSRIDRALDWAKGSQQGSVRIATADRPSPVDDPSRRAEEIQIRAADATPAPAAVAREAAGSIATSTKPEPPERRRNQEVSEAYQLSSVLVAIKGAVEGLYHRLAEQVKRLEDECDNHRLKTAAAREEVIRLEAELRSLKEEIAKEQDHCQELLTERTRLQERQSEHDRELARVRQEGRQLHEDLTQAKQEIEAIRRRADDWIHEANLARDSAERSLQSRLWERLRPSLLEVLDDHVEHPNLNPDQEIFHHRLGEIRDALRELGVQPH